MKYLTFLFFFISLESIASNSLINQLQSLNDKSIDCSNLSEDELSLQCAHAICGNPDTKVSRINSKNAHKYLSPEKYKEFQAISKNFKLYVDKAKKDFNLLVTEISKRKSSISLNDISNWADDDFTPFTDFLWSNINYDIDFNQSLKTRVIKLKSSESGTPHFLAKKEMIDNFSITDDPERSLNLGIINFEEFRQLIIPQADELEKKLKAAGKKIPFASASFSFQVNSGSNDSDGILKIYHSMLEVGRKEGIQIVPRICKMECQKSIASLVSKIDIADLKRRFEEQMNDSSIEDRIAICKSEFMSSHMENTKKENFNKVWPEIKKNYEQNVFSKFSQHSHDLLSNYLNNDLEFKFNNPFPPTIKTNIQERMKVSPTNLSTFKDSSLLGKALNIQNYRESIIDESPCSSKPQDSFLLWDLYAPKEYQAMNPDFNSGKQNPNTDSIYVSPYACEHLEDGKGIIAHELGHAISHVMGRNGMSKSSLKKYLDIRKCASSNWSTNPKLKQSIHKNDKLFTEEDTADVLSYLAINDSSSLYGCSLLLSNGESYEALNLVPPFKARHSPGMVRLLREVQHKASGKIPSTCSELIKRNKDKVGKSCFIR